jgi:hypothetical protein
MPAAGSDMDLLPAFHWPETPCIGIEIRVCVNGRSLVGIAPGALRHFTAHTPFFNPNLIRNPYKWM